MVCHESYKDKDGNWLYPDEVKKIDIIIMKKRLMVQSYSWSTWVMSKSKNTIDEAIAQYGADSVRWFIMSDSPPEKDIQWSNVGVAANKFYKEFGT